MEPTLHPNGDPWGVALRIKPNWTFTVTVNEDGEIEVSTADDVNGEFGVVRVPEGSGVNIEIFQ